MSDDSKVTLGQSVTALAGVGPVLANRLERLGVRKIEDLLFLIPLRYEDRTRQTPIGSLRIGQRALIAGDILHAEVSTRGRRAFLARIGDGTGQLTMRLFHFSSRQAARFERGARLACFGEVRPGPQGIEMIHPEYQHLKPDTDAPTESSLTAVYPSTEGVSQQRMRALVGHALALLARSAPRELLPADIIEREGLPTLAEAIATIHRPAAGTGSDVIALGTHPGVRRLALEELLANHLSLRRLRATVRRTGAPAMQASRDAVAAFIESLPFELTGAQHRVLDDILVDLANAEPMLRLVQGDVGSGKTVVAAAAAVHAVAAGYQVAVMAPTELLAEQHRASFERWLTSIGLAVGHLSGSLGARERRETLAALEDGTIDVVTGTHALFQESVTFARAGLVIIDEQHRFGVDQRLALTEKSSDSGLTAHQLVMTATPIPRTLAMTAYADFDTSVIDELPPGRTPVTTVALPDTRRGEVVERIRAACAAGRQAYWVCPLIEQSDKLDAQAAEASHERLARELAELRIGLVHGRLASRDKETVMRAFKAGKLNLLVATTVIEVGVDVPNASLMVIENSERLGLAQLHQLRGRVGRGNEASSCVLMYRAPLSELARERLAVLRRTNDGFEIADKDLELRGPGDVLGTRQTGRLQFRIADLGRDRALLPRIAGIAAELARGDERAVDALIDRWLGSAERYAAV